MNTVGPDDDLSLEIASDVHPPDAYSRFLIHAVQLGPEDRYACDLTTGSGYHALCLARRSLNVVAIDQSPRATKLAARNAEVNGLSNVDVRQGNLYAALRPDEKFDCIVAWPPVMPTPDEGDGPRDHWWRLANEGGPDGRAVFDRVIRGAGEHLRIGGALWSLHPWYLSMRVTERVAESAGLAIEKIADATFPMGVLSMSRLRYLASLGMHPEVIDGIPVQQMTVVRLRVK